LGYNKVNFFILVKGGALIFIEFVEKVFDAEISATMAFRQSLAARAENITPRRNYI
jgi:hypothetical protein